jgi:molecular chaperone GrpE
MSEPTSTHSNGAQNPAGSEPSAETTAQPAGTDTKTQELEALVKEKENKCLYLYAEFENYKKRAIKERSDTLKFGWEPVARELLGVLDNLDRAVQHLPPQIETNFAEGLKMIATQFAATLQKQGVQPVETLKTPFNPELHEAVGQEASSEASGTVIKEHLKGYTLHGRLLRPARVVISSGTPSA